MPGRDGAGPTGMGPLTGRGLGYCRSEEGHPRYSYRVGRGRFLRRGCGRWMGYGYRENVNNKEDFLVTLKNQQQWIQEKIEEIENDMTKES